MNPAMLCMAGTTIVAWAVAGSTALATVTNDRAYKLDGAVGAPVAVVGSAVTAPLRMIQTFRTSTLVDPSVARLR